ncbi:DNA polymerase/3'-5' exonuclease PolX [Puniceicoccales bacterium CK1056]|uniref:DNA polymerase beta n=1 Tax=Oceanipulchritudo coccoides TaxID=2706888 RepID=A0A6B2M220_9BACT|nr:DNA polymerase/3'-5' exonuclease PolX [Oceanipulchritudo coccoides]NDV62382.1 DNA polymerase/3'-5' exonuclease PolX [Oceanipulchritudo coccoides]
MEVRDIASRLEEIGVLLELKGENPFKVRAYQSGARTLESLEEDLDILIEEERLNEVKGIGQALTEKIIELRTTGELPFYDKLRASIPDGLIEMLEIPGFGPKKIRKVHKALGVETIDALKEVCESGQIAELPGFGAKSAANILSGIENRIAYGKRHLWWDVEKVALPLLEGLRSLPEVDRAEVAGSFRRARETVGDLDFIVASSRPAPIMEWFTTRKNVVEVSAKGETKSSVRFDGGLQADLRVVPGDRFVFALHHFTGSKDHNVKMRQRALGLGLSLSEWGIFNKGDEPSEESGKAYDRPLAKKGIEEEADLFEALGLDFVPPERREGIDEIELAEKHKLEKPLPLDVLKGTFHNHTKASDGHNTLEEMSQAAADMGLEYIGIADHSKASFQANGLSEERLLEQVREIHALNKNRGKRAHLFAGSEVDILKDGSLDFEKDILKELDYCVLSVHGSMSGQSETEMTQRIIRAIETDTGCLKILGHPTGRLLLRREGYAVNVRKLIDAARDNGVLIELNANPWRMDMDWRYWAYAKEQGVPCVITPDAHRIDDLAFLRVGILTARKAGLTPVDVFNASSLDKIKSALKKAKA